VLITPARPGYGLAPLKFLMAELSSFLILDNNPQLFSGLIS